MRPQEKRVPPEQVTVFLAVHLVFNSLLIFFFATHHSFIKYPFLVERYWDSVLQYDLILVESLLLVLPGYLLCTLLARWLPRTGLVLGVAAIALVPLIYYADLMLFLLVGSRLFSTTSLRLVSFVLPQLFTFTPQTSYSRVLSHGAIFLAVQVISVLVAIGVCRCLTVRRSSKSKLVIVIVLAVMLGPIAYQMREPRTFCKMLRVHADRHPIFATSLLDIADYDGGIALAWLLRQEVWASELTTTVKRNLPAIDRRYRQLTITDGPKKTPDVLLIMIESLRHDALSETSAPNLVALANDSITSTWHFSAGNRSDIGICGVMYGRDPIFRTQRFIGSERPADWLPPALPKLFKEAGYYCAFLGTEHGSNTSFSAVISPSSFDYFQKCWGSGPYYECDRKMIGQAIQILNRTGPYRDLKGQPVLIFLFVYTTHSDYHSAPEDQVFLPTFPDKMPAPPWYASEAERVHNRYLNSVHCADRLLAPLLDRERLIVVCGDHGESLPETIYFDRSGGVSGRGHGNWGHGTAMDLDQIRTPLIVHIPNRPPEKLHSPTFHMDILPTVLDAIGVTVNHRNVLNGRSLLKPAATRRRSVFSVLSGIQSVRGGDSLGLFSAVRQQASPMLIYRFEGDNSQWRSDRSAIGDMRDNTSLDGNYALESDLRSWLDHCVGMRRKPTTP